MMIFSGLVTHGPNSAALSSRKADFTLPLVSGTFLRSACAAFLTSRIPRLVLIPSESSSPLRSVQKVICLGKSRGPDLIAATPVLANVLADDGVALPATMATPAAPALFRKLLRV